MLRAGYGNRMEYLMPPHDLRNFEIQQYLQNEPRFNGVSSRANVPGKQRMGNI